MTPITLQNLANGQQITSAVSAINANNAAIITALENTLDRQGSAPNSMQADLDMNSFNILNLPPPSTINSPVRIADLSSGSSISFPNYNGVVLYAANFPGPTAGDQIANCIAALPAAGGVCDARGLVDGGTIPGFTISQSAVTILGPIGQFFVTGTINVYNPSGIEAVSWLGCGASVAGGGSSGTHFVWTGNASSPMFRLRGCRDSVFRDFFINSSAGLAPLAEGIRLETATGTTSTNRMFHNIAMNGTNTNGLGKGFRWCIGDDAGGAGPDANNDIDTLYNVEVENYTNAAFSIEHRQSKTHTFFNCTFLTGARGVTTTQATNPSNNTGSFRWFGGGGGSNTIADFDLSSPDDVIYIQGFNTENSNRLLLTAGNSSAPWPITFIGGRFACNGLNADNNVIVYTDRGPLNVIGCTFEGVAGRQPTLNINTTGTCRGNAIGNNFNWDTPITSASSPFTSTPTSSWNIVGNTVSSTAGAIQFPIEDAIVGIGGPSIFQPAVVANGALSPTVPAGYALTHIYIQNTTANAVTGGINIGTTALASDVVSAFAIGANAFVTIPAASISKNVFSASSAQTLFISAASAFNSASLNVVVKLQRAIP